MDYGYLTYIAEESVRIDCRLCFYIPRKWMKNKRDGLRLFCRKQKKNLQIFWLDKGAVCEYYILNGSFGLLPQLSRYHFGLIASTVATTLLWRKIRKIFDIQWRNFVFQIKIPLQSTTSSISCIRIRDTVRFKNAKNYPDPIWN